MKKQFEKGVMGAMLRDFKQRGPRPFLVSEHCCSSPFLVSEHCCSSALIMDAKGHALVAYTLRGNAHDRRKQRRALQRWLNEGAKP